MEEQPAGRSRPSRRLVWLGLALLAVIGLAAYSRRPPYRPLFENARRVPGYQVSGTPYPDAWGWASEHEMVFLDPFNPRRVVRLDVESGQNSTITFPAPKKADTTPLPGRPVEVSPDGRQVYFVGGIAGRPHYLIEMATGRVRELPGSSTAWPAWAPDASNWLEWSQGQMTVVRRSDLHRTTYPVALPGQQLLWYDGRERVVTCDLPQPGARAKFLETTLREPITTRPLPVRLPDGISITRAELSPKGDRVAWWVAWGNEPQTWMSRVMQWLRRQRLAGPAEEATEGVLISRPDGTEMRELGRVKAEYAPVGMGVVGWLPDGKRLCIQYRNGFYVVPVD